MRVDLVYLWVNGNDPQWREKKNNFLPKDKQLSVDVSGDCRFLDNGELRFSLRSAEMFAPWINHIFIVTDAQVPEWLDVNHPKITIIDHKEIIDESCLPTYNSVVLELFLHKIPSLSEHFIYANDDMFFARELTEDFFFHADGTPKVRLHKQKIKNRKGIYQRQIYKAQMLAKARFGKYFSLAPHHNIDSYRKSDFESIHNLFPDQVAQTLSSRFRDEEDLQRVIISYYVLAVGMHKAIKVNRYNRAKGLFSKLRCIISGHYGTDSRCLPLDKGNFAGVLSKYNPSLFTINDSHQAVDEHREAMRLFLEHLYPHKSSFEL